ncbi:MAG: 2-C-methyl-D-erythritol 2,4-cyclodiphosphate synthase [Erysipelotrichaceae bacterium]
MYRIGQSQDIHQLVTGRKLILGGVEIEHTMGLLGHSDADVLLHAIAESILGALALGDLGKHFSDTDETTRGQNSMGILARVYEMMSERGYEINNLDALILIEKPKMAPHIANMVSNIATCLHCNEDQINVKATRGEKLGFVGRQEGVMATCVVLLRKVK